MSEMNIYQRMQKATAEIGIVAKNLCVDTGRGKSYKAVAEADVLAAVKPAEDKYGIYSYPVKREIIDSGEIVNTYNNGGVATERRQLYIRLHVVYRFVNVDDPTDYIEIDSFGDGVDPQDKAPGKAITYADKYALLKAYKMQTGDDPDASASGDLKRREPGRRKITPTEVETLNRMMEPNQVAYVLEVAGVNKLEDLSPEQYAQIVQRLRDK